MFLGCCASRKRHLLLPVLLCARGTSCFTVFNDTDGWGSQITVRRQDRVKLALIIIGLVLALVGWYKPSTAPLWLIATVTVVLIVAAGIQVALLRKERKDKKKDQYAGELTAKTVDVMLSAETHVYPKLELGDSGAILVYAGEPGTPLFKFFENSHLTVVRDAGRVKVSTTIYDSRGTLVAELANNEWRVNKNASFDRNFTNDALEVKDSSGEIILQVQLVEDRIQLQGKFYGPNGEGVAIGKGADASGNPSGMMEITGPKHPRLVSKIAPMFRYPSDLHLGERLSP